MVGSEQDDMTDRNKGLLDLMLEESRKVEEKPVGMPLMAEQPPERTPPKTLPPWPQEVEQLLELSDHELRRLLGEAAPNDLLCVMAEGSHALRNRVLGQLDPQSVAWMRGNLELWDPATEALKTSSRDAVLKVAREMIFNGRLTKPETAASEGVVQDAAGEIEHLELAGTLGQLVDLAYTNGRAALKAVIDEVPHPMLHFSLKCLVEGQEGVGLEHALAERLRALESAYRSELEMIRQATLAIDRREDARTFLMRVEAADLV